MNILVTVGTTAFDSLISAVDQNLGCDNSMDITAQISMHADYKPKNIDFFEFSDDFQSYVDSADLIITHAGAGSIYAMLESNKKLVVVPNITRADNHQLELAGYVQDNNFAKSCFDLSDIKACVEEALQTKFNEYQCKKFFGHSLILGLLK